MTVCKEVKNINKPFKPVVHWLTIKQYRRSHGIVHNLYLMQHVFVLKIVMFNVHGFNIWLTLESCVVWVFWDKILSQESVSDQIHFLPQLQELSDSLDMSLQNHIKNHHDLLLCFKFCFGLILRHFESVSVYELKTLQEVGTNWHHIENIVNTHVIL